MAVRDVQNGSELRTDPRADAAAAGLRYVEDTEPGLSRRRRGRGFEYLDIRGKTLGDADTKERVSSLAIPPAWRDVWICPHPDGHLQATGVDAALLMQRAVTLVEPALPVMRPGGTVPLAEGAPGYAAVRFLHQRRLLTQGWNEHELTQETWSGMLGAFLDWYDLNGPLPDAPSTAGDVVDDVAVVLERVARTIRPAALLASDPADGNKLKFWAIIWNWTVYPRLLVVRPDVEVDLGNDPRAVLPNLGNCAVRVTNFVTAPQETAKRLFLTHNDSRMYIVGSQPERSGWPLEITAGAELEAFDFSLAELGGVNVYAAVFDGPEVGFGTILGLMTRVRTNMSPVAFLSHMQTP